MKKYNIDDRVKTAYGIGNISEHRLHDDGYCIFCVTHRDGFRNWYTAEGMEFIQSDAPKRFVRKRP